jgi:hypothetical protein
MKKFLIIAVIIAVMVPAAAAHAFSFGDLLNLGRKLIQRETPPAPKPAEIKKEIAAQPAQLYTLSAKNKFDNWQNAFAKKNIGLVLADDRNLYFTDAELNYLIARELASTTDPAASDITISFSDNLAKVSGHSLVKNFNGRFYLEAKPAIVNKRISFQVTRARFNNFYFPAFLAQALLAGQLREAITFLYSDPDRQDLSLTLGSGFIQLNYAQ